MSTLRVFCPTPRVIPPAHFFFTFWSFFYLLRLRWSVLDPPSPILVVCLCRKIACNETQNFLDYLGVKCWTSSVALCASFIQSTVFLPFFTSAPPFYKPPIPNVFAPTTLSRVHIFWHWFDLKYTEPKRKPLILNFNSLSRTPKWKSSREYCNICVNWRLQQSIFLAAC